MQRVDETHSGRVRGMILCLPSRKSMPSSSVLLKDVSKTYFPYFSYPIVIIACDSISHTCPRVTFFPVVVLSGGHLQEARSSAMKLIWPEYLYLSQSWTLEETLLEQKTTEARWFPQVYLDYTSLRPGNQLWVRTSQAFTIELEYLLPFPIPVNNFRYSLPNPPIRVHPISVNGLAVLAQKQRCHPLNRQATQMESLADPYQVQVGQIYRLPSVTNNLALCSAQAQSFFERPLGQPFLVIQIRPRRSSPSEGGQGLPIVRGLALTSFHNQPIRNHYHRQDRKTAWIRRQYIPVEGSGTESHDEIPYAQLSEDSAQLSGKWYINVMRHFDITSQELCAWTAEGTKPIRIWNLDELWKYSTAMREVGKRRFKARSQGKDQDMVDFNVDWTTENGLPEVLGEYRSDSCMDGQSTDHGSMVDSVSSGDRNGRLS